MNLLLLCLFFLAASDSPPPPIITTAVGTGAPGFAGDGGPAEKALLNNPFDVAFDRQGNLFLSDTFNQRIRRVDARTGIITTIAGNGRKGFSGDGGPAIDASLDEPYGIAIDAKANLYFADRLNHRVRRVDLRTGLISTVAGNNSKIFAGDGGPASQACLAEPNSVGLDPQGRRLFIADVADHRLRMVDLASGTISTFAGTGHKRHSGDDGPARLASLLGPRAVEVGPDGTVFLLERDGNTLRAIDPKTHLIATIAGNGKKGHSGNGGPALSATFNGPKELALDPVGNVLIVDTENQMIRRIDVKTHTITVLAGTGRLGPSGDGGLAPAAQLARPHGVAVGPEDAIYIGDTENHRIRKVMSARILPP